MRRLKRCLGYVSLICLVFVAALDMGSYFGLSPVICGADRGFGAYIYCGMLSVEWAGASRISNLEEIGHPIFLIDYDFANSRYAAFAKNGRHIGVVLIEIILVVPTAVFLVIPAWAARLRKKEGKCQSCEYIVAGIDSDICPECGGDIPAGTTRDVDRLKPSRIPRRVRYLVFPLFALYSALLLFHSAISAITPSKCEMFLKRDQRPGVFLVRSGERCSLIHEQGRADIYFSPTTKGCCRYIFEWNSRDSEPVTGAGILSESPPVCTEFKVGSIEVGWSIGDANHHWIYLSDDTTPRLETNLP